MDYSNLMSLAHKASKNSHLYNESLHYHGLDELIEANRHRKNIDISLESFATAYCSDLKNCLEHESLESLLEDFFRLETHLNSLAELEQDVATEALSEFYHYLSPVFLRVLKESIDGQVKGEMIMSRCLEALRVALEEELYLWQEKLANQ